MRMGMWRGDVLIKVDMSLLSDINRHSRLSIHLSTATPFGVPHGAEMDLGRTSEETLSISFQNPQSLSMYSCLTLLDHRPSFAESPYSRFQVLLVSS